MLQSAQNPQAMMQNLIANNPQVRQVMDYVNQNGGDAQKAFYALAEQQGVDPNEILGLLR